MRSRQRKTLHSVCWVVVATSIGWGVGATMGLNARDNHEYWMDVGHSIGYAAGLKVSSALAYGEGYDTVIARDVLADDMSL